MWILQCILGLQSQIIDFKDPFYQADIPSGETFFIGIIRYFKSNVEQFDVFIMTYALAMAILKEVVSFSKKWLY